MAGTTYISYYGGISEVRTRIVMNTCAEVLAQNQPDRLYFLFSSGGGSVDAAMALYNFLRALPVPLVMHNTGSVDSVANVVFLAADERYASPQAMFLLHGITWGFGQGAQLTWSQLQETVSRFRADESRVAGVITTHTTITRDELIALFHQGETKNLAFAKDKGIIQDTRDADIEGGASLVMLRFPDN